MPIKKIALFVVALAVVGGVAYYVYQPAPAPTPQEEITYVLGTTEGHPSLTHEVVFTDSLPEEARVVIRERIAKNVAKLEAHPEDGNTWMDLALWYHQANDYDAAREVWEFIVSVTPTNVTVLNNLGRLHHFDLHEYATAETYFNQALTANPDRLETYLELFDLYRYSYKKDTSAAVDIMKRTIEKFPDEIGLLANLGSYYRDVGRPAQARATFEEALKRARDAGDLQLVGVLNAELSKLE